MHTVVGAAASDAPPAPERIEGTGVDGVALDNEAYVFPSAGPQKTAAALAYRAPSTATLHVVTSLARGARYTVALTREGAARSKVALAPGEGLTATPAGLLLLHVKECALGKNP